MSNNTISRAHYFERQFLRTQDFADEQAYHLAMRRRHNIAHHSWGIVGGLEVVVEEEELFVQPGMAVDGYGRELIVAAKRPLSTGSFVEKDSDALDVWLVYDRVGSEQAPAGYAGCGNGADGAFYRWQERPLIRLEVPDPAYTDRRKPKTVPTGDLDFSPSRQPPDNPELEWPVFLGQIRQDTSNPDQPLTVDPAGRPYVGLVGEVAVSPAGGARVEIGTEVDDDGHRFAIVLAEQGKRLSAHPAPNDPQPKFEIADDGEIAVRGATTLHGDLTMKGGAVEFKVGPANAQSSSGSPSEPDSAQPWRVYHARCKVGQREDQLRIEMAEGTSGRNEVVIGAWSSDDNEFKPCLTVRDDCTVTVHGNLVVQGRIVEADKAAVKFTERAQDFITSAIMGGLGTVGIPVDVSSQLPPTEPALLGMQLAASAQGCADVLATDPGQLEAFLSLLQSEEYAGLADALREVLTS